VTLAAAAAVVSIVRAAMCAAVASPREYHPVCRVRLGWLRGLGQVPEREFRLLFRLTRHDFNALRDALGDRLGVNKRMAALSSGEGIPSECRLALALRMLAGASYLDCMLAFGIGRCTVYTVFHEVRSRFSPVVVTPFLSAHSRVSLSPDSPFWYSFIPRPWPTILFRQPPDLCSSVVCLKPYLAYFSLVHLHVGACCFGRCSSAAEH